MARTRLDPWQAEQPEFIWKNSTLDSIIPNAPPLLSPPSHGFPRSGLKVLSPKAISNSTPHFKPIPLSKSTYPYHPDLKYSHISSHSKHLSSSHSSSKPLWVSSTKHKHSSKSRSRKYEFNTAASKVLAALNISNMNSLKHKSHTQSDFDFGVKLKKRKRLGLPKGDTRKNMVSLESVPKVPKVVLRDIGAVISKVCPKLASSISPTGSPNGKQLSSCPSNIIELEPEHGLSSQVPPTVTLDEPSLPEISPTKIKKGITLALKNSGKDLSAASSRKSATLAPKTSSATSSEKSCTPVSMKEATFASLASAAQKNLNSKTVPLTSNWPSCSKLLPSYPIESVSSMSSVPSATFQKSSSSIRERSSVFFSELDSRSDNSNTRQTDVILVEPKSSILSTRLGSSISTPDSPKKSQSCSRKLKFPPPIKNGFLGFPQEDGKKLKVRFHVNTNILASSLDLLDLHKNAGMPSGSPTICPCCSIIFSSVKHCKYHQSFTSSTVTSDPSRHNNIQEDGVWLCPWCPLMCTSIDFLNTHKLVCRDNGQCQQQQKVSSVRKSASSSSRRRNTSTTTVNEVLTSPNRYKVVHGQVIQL